MHRRPDQLSGRVAAGRDRARAGQPPGARPRRRADGESGFGGGEAILDLMHELRDQYDAAFLVASHDPRVLARMDRVVTIRDGHIVDDRPVHDVRSLAVAGRA